MGRKSQFSLQSPVCDVSGFVGQRSWSHKPSVQSNSQDFIGANVNGPEEEKPDVCLDVMSGNAGGWSLSLSKSSWF